MGNFVKRALSLALSLVLVLSLVPAAVFATETAAEPQSSGAAVNTSTGVTYTSVSEACDEAEAGQTIQLTSDFTDDTVVIDEEITLDLAGYNLTADYVASYGDIIDSSEGTTGLLTVPANHLMLETDNTQLPVRDGEGYRFVEIIGYNTAMVNENKYAFQPLFEADAHRYLAAGAEATGVSIQVDVSWTQDGTDLHVQFAYTDELVNGYINSYNASTGKYSKMFTLTKQSTGYYENLGFEAIVISDSDVRIGAGATYPEGKVDGKVEVDSENKLVNDVTVYNNQGSATIQAGTQLEDATGELKLTASQMDSTGTDITLSNGEQLQSFDVHVSGVSKDNTVPVIITLNELAPEFLNRGNLDLYHVENGVTVPMTRVYTQEEVDVHNEYYYDIATGTVTLAMATFSEVATVSDTEKKWEGKFDYTWYAPNADGYVIANADQLAAFGAIVGGMDGQTRDSFADKTVKLIADINLGDAESSNNPDIIFYPIGYYNSEYTYAKSGNAISSNVSSFQGTFDGAGHTIKNFYQNTWEMKGDDPYYAATEQRYNDAMGLFGYVVNGTVKNLTVDNFSSDGEFTPTGVIAAYAVNSTFENISLTNCNPRVYNTGNGGIIGVAGRENDAVEALVLRNITVDNSNKISALWGSWDVACGGLVGMYRGNADSSGNATGDTIYFENCHVSAQIDVYNDVCANYQYYAYRYAGMIIGSIRHNTKNDAGRTIPNMAGVSASGCTVHFGTWNDYYYCELVANSLASYTHDHQMSRLVQVTSVDVNAETYVPLGETESVAIPTSGRVNYVVVSGDHATANATCYHFVDGAVWNHEDAGTETVNNVEVLKEDKQHIYLEFNNLFTGYGWGVSSQGLTDFEGIENMAITQGDHENSVEKFEGKVAELENNKEYKLGDIFSFVDNGVVLVPDALTVTVNNLDENNPVSIGSFVRNSENWENGTITFVGAGTVQLTIQDYYFCTPTTIKVTITERVAVEKFAAVENAAITAGETVKLGELFTAVEGVNIDSESVEVTISGVNYTYTKNDADWTQSSIVVNQASGIAKVTITDNDYCLLAEGNFNIVENDAFKADLVNSNFLCRVGNANALPLNKLFSIIDSDTINGDISITATSLLDNQTNIASATISKDALSSTNLWSSVNFVGPIELTIDALGANAITMNLEVVDAWNATSALSVPYKQTVDSKDYYYNVVLLNNTSGTFTVSGNYGFYGNGFTITLDPASHSTKKGAGFDGYIHMNGGTIDNVRIEGPVFAESYIYQTQGQTGTNADDPVNYFRNGIIVDSGDAKITNSYVSGARTALYIKSGGNVVVENTRVSGGAYANIEVLSSESLTLSNVVTEQKATKDSYGQNKDVVGIGVVINNADTKLVLDGLMQYNWINQTQWETMLGSYKSAFPQLFGSSYTNLQHTYNGITVVNSGIIWACDVTKPSVEGELTGYDYTTISLGGKNGVVYTTTNQSGDTAILDDSVVTAPDYMSDTQGYVPPSATFDYYSKNNEPEQSGSNDYCYYNSTEQKFQISFDEGESKNWYYDILTVEKGPATLPYTVTVSGDAVVNLDNTVTFSAAGDYVVTYTYDDAMNYKLSDGTIHTYTQSYKKYVYVTVFVVAPEADPTTFAFGSNEYKTVAAGGLVYAMPNVTAIKAPTKSNNVVTASGIGSTTIDGEVIYYPIIGMHKVGNSFSYYNYFSIFEAVTINDADKTSTYSTATTTLPSNLTVTGGFILDANDAVSTQESANGTGIFNYSTGKTIKTNSVTVKGTSVGLCYYPDSSFSSSTTARAEQTIVVKYCYTDTNGKSYYYYIGYWCAPGNNGIESSSSGCFAEGTIITLADGTQKPVEQITYEDELLAWDFHTGSYAVTVPSLLEVHEVEECRVINLRFADGTVVRIVADHGFFDADANEFVFIDESNVASFVGHKFVKMSADSSYENVELVGYDVTVETVSYYTIQTAIYNNCIAENMFTLTSPSEILDNDDWFNYFEIGEGMKYDEAKKQADIEKYGLYTYEEFAELVTYEQFVAFNGPYLKVLVGKGVVTYEQIVELIAIYVNPTN